jgi:hypothetical protein
LRGLHEPIHGCDRALFMRSKIAVLVMLVSGVGTAGALPQFEDYRVPVETIAKPKLDLQSHPQARPYRTRLREALDDGKKFAGHYVVASWGCGSSCEQFAFIDAASGKVYLPGMVTYPVWDERCADLYGLDFRADSALLKIYGSPNEKKEAGTYYFVWTDGKLKEVAHVAGCPRSSS